ncbi:hypothetical protein B0H17DRAFT_1074089 [Mycena rosella]|uniref:Uncharacterized protein n=1 Tax=Mycena rosella TaxID=1033263 RepID=A0AAD7D806_MYCRO|nr:hypothetical protein B0H17DRAFT_1074089 [Mycena rosella]
MRSADQVGFETIVFRRRHGPRVGVSGQHPVPATNCLRVAATESSCSRWVQRTTQVY